MAERTRQTRRGRRGSGARSVAQAEAELSDDVRRRLRASERLPEGWVPTTPEDARDEIAPDEAHSFADPAPTAARLRGALRDRVPVALRGADVVPSRKAVAGLAGLLVAALVLVLGLTWLQRPSESPAPSVRRSVPASAVLSLPPSATPSSGVVVHVVGAVRRPGLVELAGGSRVDDAVAAAGGATHKADLGSVNLARVLVDGEQIVVLRKGEAGAAGATGPSTGGSALSGRPVDLNAATIEQLDGLPGVGPVLAKRIFDWRAAHGRFSSVDELTQVSGIGERTLADLRPLVHV